MRSWLLVALLLTLGGLAFACSSGSDDASPTTTPTDSGDAVTDTPSDETEGGSPTPDSAAEGPTDGTDSPADGTDGSAGGTDGDPEAPGGRPQAQEIPPSLSTAEAIMRLTILDGGSCDAGECFVDAGSTFTLAVEVLRAPASGYVLMQTFIDFGVYNPSASEDGAGPGSCGDGEGNGGRDGEDRTDSDCATVVLTYLPEPAAADEVVWSDAAEGITLREVRGAGLVQHGSLTGLIPPLPISNETGVVVEVQMSCPASPVTVPISLLASGDPVAGSSGSLFVRPDEIQIIPSVLPINLHCQ